MVGARRLLPMLIGLLGAACAPGDGVVRLQVTQHRSTVTTSSLEGQTTVEIVVEGTSQGDDPLVGPCEVLLHEVRLHTENGDPAGKTVDGLEVDHLRFDVSASSPTPLDLRWTEQGSWTVDSASAATIALVMYAECMDTLGETTADLADWPVETR